MSGDLGGQTDDELVESIGDLGTRYDAEMVAELARRHVRGGDGWCAWCGVQNDARRSLWPCRPACVVIEARHR